MLIHIGVISIHYSLTKESSSILCGHEEVYFCRLVKNGLTFF